MDATFSLSKYDIKITNFLATQHKGAKACYWTRLYAYLTFCHVPYFNIRSLLAYLPCFEKTE
jgi:phage-related protein